MQRSVTGNCTRTTDHLTFITKVSRPSAYRATIRCLSPASHASYDRGGEVRSMSWWELLLVPLGFAVGTYGTLVGAGGGFVLVPALLIIYPDESPSSITSISLAVVFFNALS